MGIQDKSDSIQFCHYVGKGKDRILIEKARQRFLLSPVAKNVQEQERIEYYDPTAPNQKRVDSRARNDRKKALGTDTLPDETDLDFHSMNPTAYFNHILHAMIELKIEPAVLSPALERMSVEVFDKASAGILKAEKKPARLRSSYMKEDPVTEPQLFQIIKASMQQVLTDQFRENYPDFKKKFSGGRENLVEQKHLLDSKSMKMIADLIATDPLIQNVFRSQRNYIEAVVDTYASFPAYRREEIWFHERLEPLREYVSDNLRHAEYIRLHENDSDPVKRTKYEDHLRKMVTLEIKNSQGCFLVIPLGLEQDGSTGHLYLLGVGTNVEDPGNPTEFRTGTFEPKGFRVSRLNQCKKATYPLAYTNACLSMYEKALKERDVAFFTAKLSEFHLQLTPEGKHKYRLRTNNRPLIEWDEAHGYYKCRTTAFRLELYFMPFGKDVRILPLYENKAGDSKKNWDITDNFRKAYSEALKQYCDSPIPSDSEAERR